MKIAEIRIGRFGRWSDLSLPLPARGLSVVYGPNEAGKSTLMRFIRGVLYGFDPFGPEKPASAAAVPCTGSLRIECDGVTCSISRTAQRGSRGLVSIDGAEGQAWEQQFLERLLADTDEKIYERVFAIGLHELQELATLHEADVAGHIYGLSLGPEGQRLLEVTGEIGSDLNRLLDVGQGSGELVDLLLRYEELLGELDDAAASLERHRELRRNVSRLESDVADIKRRQAGIESQLRGHQLLERVWEPWNQVRQYEHELDRLPRIDAFPQHGVARLDELDQEIESLVAKRDAMKTRIDELRKQSAAVPVDRNLQTHAAAMQAFVDQREWIIEGGARQQSLQAECDRLEEEIAESVAALGPAWTLERLAGVDASPRTHQRIDEAARRYRSALLRRNRLRKQYRRRTAACQRRLAALQDDLKSLQGVPLESALQAARKRLDRLEELNRATLREADLEERGQANETQIASLKTRLELPKWVSGILGLFGVVGLAAVVLGIIAGAFANAVAGLMWALLGTTCALLAWAMKTHYEAAAADSIDRLLDDSHQNAVRLRETRQAIERLTKSNRLGSDRSMDDQPTHAAEQTRQAIRRLAQLEQWSATHARLQIRRKQLTAQRSRLRQAQRDVGAARLAWCQTLTDCGLTETVRVGDGLDEWQRVGAAAQQHAFWKRLSEELRNQGRLFDSLRQRLEKLGSKLGPHDLRDADAAVMLARWEEALESFAECRKTLGKLRREAKALKREAAGLGSRIRDLKTKRAALLVQGGAATRQEFESRAKLVAEREDAKELLELAAAELEAAAETEPELAVVEEDLLAYNGEENRRCIEVLASELGELEAELEQAFENLGGLRQMTQELETEERSADLRLENVQLEERFRRTAEEWMALQLAARTVAEMKSEFEKTCQPVTLAAASRHLRKLTAGRYRNVWTPLGERHLCVDDERGRTFRVEQLSNGTREQLFLAIRLALVGQFSANNVSLPMVLDDVIVNFDHTRTEAAVDTLIDFAHKEDQQILLFTCHLHLAQMFESKGIEPIRLPSRQPAAEERAAG